MTEKEYIDATNHVKLMMAARALRDMSVEQEGEEWEKRRDIIIAIENWAVELEQKNNKVMLEPAEKPFVNYCSVCSAEEPYTDGCEECDPNWRPPADVDVLPSAVLPPLKSLLVANQRSEHHRDLQQLHPDGSKKSSSTLESEFLETHTVLGTEEFRGSDYE